MLVHNNCQLKQFYRECQKDKYIAVDTEFYWTNTYRAIPCLIQIANSKRTILIDLISLKININYVRKILLGTKALKIFHSARQDLEIIYNLLNEIPKNIFDTQIGSLIIGYKQTPSLQTLCAELIDKKIEKINQNIDWRIRPLSLEQINYSINDVKYLIPLYKNILSKITKLKRIDWFRDHNKKLINITNYNQKEKSAWKKIKFKPKFENEMLLLKKFSEIRERIASRNNIPPKHLLSDSNLKEICKFKKSKFHIIKLIKNKKIVEKILVIRHKHFKTFLKPVKKLNESELQKLKIAKELLIKKSDLYNIHPSLIANKSELETIIKGNENKLIQGWRLRVFGKDFIDKIS